MSSKEIKAKLAAIRKDLIDSINNYLTLNSAKELKLTKTIVYTTVEDEYDHTVYSIKKGIVVIDDSLQADYYDVKLSDLTNDFLIKILETVEKDKYEVYEELPGKEN